MNDKQASEAFWVAVNLLNAVIENGVRGTKADVLADLEGNLDD